MWSLWRKFQFFERAALANGLPTEIRGDKVSCRASGRGKTVFGTHQGHVLFIGRKLEPTKYFKAHEGIVAAVCLLKVRIFICIFVSNSHRTSFGDDLPIQLNVEPF